MTFVVERAGQEITILATPRYDNAAKRYLLGIVTTIGTKRESFIPALTESARATGFLMRESVKSLFTLPTKVPQLIRQTFGDEKRDPNGLVSCRCSSSFR